MILTKLGPDTQKTVHKAKNVRSSVTLVRVLFASRVDGMMWNRQLSSANDVTQGINKVGEEFILFSFDGGASIKKKR